VKLSPSHDESKTIAALVTPDHDDENDKTCMCSRAHRRCFGLLDVSGMEKQIGSTTTVD
jgi:hypothetical protein